jgi:MFS family permease
LNSEAAHNNRARRHIERGTAMRVWQGIFAVGLGLLAGGLTGVIGGQYSGAWQYTCTAFVGGVLVGISLPGILNAVNKPR